MGFMDIFKPQWKHSDPAVRAAVIRSMAEDHQDILLSMALEDAEAGNRLAAARRVKDVDMLRKLRDRTTEKAVKEMALKQLAERLGELAKGPAEGGAALEQAKAALAEVGEDPRAL